MSRVSELLEIFPYRESLELEIESKVNSQGFNNKKLQIINKMIKRNLRIASMVAHLRSRACVCSACRHTQSLQSCPTVSLWIVALQAPLSMGFSRQKHWSGLPFPPPADLPDPGIEPLSSGISCIAGRFFTYQAIGKPLVCVLTWSYCGLELYNVASGGGSLRKIYWIKLSNLNSNHWIICIISFCFKSSYIVSNL